MRSSRLRPGVPLDAERAFLLVSLAVFSLFLVASLDLEEASSYLLPRGLAVLGLVAAAIEIVRVWGRSRRPPAGESRGLPVLATIAFAAGYFCLVPVLGFVFATALAVVVFARVARFPRWKRVAALAVVVPAVLHVVFVELLRAPLPSGLAGALPF